MALNAVVADKGEACEETDDLSHSLAKTTIIEDSSMKAEVARAASADPGAAGEVDGHVGTCPDGSVVIEASVVSGLETMAREEIREKLGLQAAIARGRVWFTITEDRLEEIWKLQSVDNLFAVVARVRRADFVGDERRDLDYLYKVVPQLPWRKSVEAWRRLRAPALTLNAIFGLEGRSVEEVTLNDLEDLPRFRVSCNRTGTNHKFTSMEAAAKVGAGINDTFHWKVSMKEFNLHVFVNICWDKVDFLIGLTAMSLHHRNLIDFGPTSLRSTIAYNMLRLCRVRAGDVICDPLCGGGSIPIEAARNFPQNLILAADHHELAIPRCHNNLVHNKPVTNCTNLLSWDSTQSPLRPKLIDVIVTDLPFGKRLGKKGDNRILYPALMKEFARISALGTARAVLLTQDKRSLIKALQSTAQFWRQGYTVGCNVGGLEAAIFVCHRTDSEYE